MDVEDKPVVSPQSKLEFNDEDQVWLVKIPNFLAESWMHAPRGSELGTVTLIHKDRTSPGHPDVELKAIPIGNCQRTNTVPLDFSCKYSDEMSKEVKIFSEDVLGNIRFEGNVLLKVDCSAKDPVLLGKAVTNFVTKIQQQEAHEIKVFEEKNLDTFVSKPATFVNHLTGNKKINIRKKGEKRERMELPILEEMIFQAFHTSPNGLLTLNQLDKMLDQPVGYLKEALEGICSYHTSGKDRLHYEIKDEFKSKKQKMDRDLSLQQQQASEKK